MEHNEESSYCLLTEEEIITGLQSTYNLFSARSVLTEASTLFAETRHEHSPKFNLTTLVDNVELSSKQYQDVIEQKVLLEQFTKTIDQSMIVNNLLKDIGDGDTECYENQIKTLLESHQLSALAECFNAVESLEKENRMKSNFETKYTIRRSLRDLKKDFEKTDRDVENVEMFHEATKYLESIEKMRSLTQRILVDRPFHELRNDPELWEIYLRTLKRKNITDYLKTPATEEEEVVAQEMNNLDIRSNEYSVRQINEPNDETSFRTNDFVSETSQIFDGSRLTRNEVSGISRLKSNATLSENQSLLLNDISMNSNNSNEHCKTVIERCVNRSFSDKYLENDNQEEISEIREDYNGEESESDEHILGDKKESKEEEIMEDEEGIEYMEGDYVDEEEEEEEEYTENSIMQEDDQHEENISTEGYVGDRREEEQEYIGNGNKRSKYESIDAQDEYILEEVDNVEESIDGDVEISENESRVLGKRVETINEEAIYTEENSSLSHEDSVQDESEEEFYDATDELPGTERMWEEEKQEKVVEKTMDDSDVRLKTKRLLEPRPIRYSVRNQTNDSENEIKLDSDRSKLKKKLNKTNEGNQSGQRYTKRIYEKSRNAQMTRKEQKYFEENNVEENNEISYEETAEKSIDEYVSKQKVKKCKYNTEKMNEKLRNVRMKTRRNKNKFESRMEEDDEEASNKFIPEEKKSNKKQLKYTKTKGNYDESSMEEDENNDSSTQIISDNEINELEIQREGIQYEQEEIEEFADDSEGVECEENEKMIEMEYEEAVEYVDENGELVEYENEEGVEYVNEDGVEYEEFEEDEDFRNEEDVGYVNEGSVEYEEYGEDVEYEEYEEDAEYVEYEEDVEYDQYDTIERNNLYRNLVREDNNYQYGRLGMEQHSHHHQQNNVNRTEFEEIDSNGHMIEYVDEENVKNQTNSYKKTKNGTRTNNRKKENNTKKNRSKK